MASRAWDEKRMAVLRVSCEPRDPDGGRELDGSPIREQAAPGLATGVRRSIVNGAARAYPTTTDVIARSRRGSRASMSCIDTAPTERRNQPSSAGTPNAWNGT